MDLGGTGVTPKQFTPLAFLETSSATGGCGFEFANGLEIAPNLVGPNVQFCYDIHGKMI